MSKYRTIGRALLVACLIVSFVWPVFAHYQSKVISNIVVEQEFTSDLPPNVASSDLVFDRYLDQVIAGQSPSGALPNLVPPSLRATFLAVQAFQQLGYAADINPTGVQSFLLSCYDEAACLFTDAMTNAFENGIRSSGYSAIEGTYYAIETFYLLDLLAPAAWQPTADAILALQDSSGGFACRAGVCTTHDAYFAYKTLELLDSTDTVNVNALANFLDGRQMSDPAEWWQYGGFINLPENIAIDCDFQCVNLISSYHAVATLAACGRLGVLNEAGLVQFIGLCRNATSNLHSYSTGNEQAEHVGTAFLLVIDQFLAQDGSINYAGAGSSLLARLEAGYLNEGRKAPANHTIAPACEMVWGLTEGGRLPELSPAGKERVRDFISRHVLVANSMAGYALTREALLHELAKLVPAITGAGKMDAMNVNTLYNFIKSLYIPITAYFDTDGAAVLQRDIPACYNPTSPDGIFVAGIATTLPALQVLKAIGRLNDFLGETHDLNNILSNITASQFLNLSAPTVHGAFCAQKGFVGVCRGDESKRAWIVPQWTLQSLETIAILDPVSPASHYDAGAAWQYLSQFYVQEPASDHFTHPAWITVSDVEWTCRVATALCHGGMASYFNPAKVNAWVIAHLDGSSAREVSWHLKFLEASTILARAPYAVSILNTLKDNLASAGEQWYHAQGGTWSDADTVGILAQFRADRQIYLLNAATPNPMILGGDNAVSVDVSSLFAIDMPTTATVTFTAFDKSITLVRGTAGHYGGSYQCPFNYSRLGSGDVNFTATKGGWQSISALGSTSFAGTLLAAVTCGEKQALNGSMLTIKGSIISVETTMKVKLGASESPAQSLAVNASVYMGETRVTNVILVEGAPGIYSGSCAVNSVGTYVIEIILQGKVLMGFTVTIDRLGTDLPNSMDLASLPAGILVGTASCGLVIVGAGAASRKRTAPKDSTTKLP